MTIQYTVDIQELIDAVLTSPGDTEERLRTMAEARAAALGGCAKEADKLDLELPAEVGKYVDKIAMHAYRVTDTDVESLRRAGLSGKTYTLSW